MANAAMTMPVVPKRSSKDFGGSDKFSTAYLLGMVGWSVPPPLGMSSRSRTGMAGAVDGIAGLVERGGDEGAAGGAVTGRAGAGAADAAAVVREGAGAGRVTSGASVANPLGGTCTIGCAVYLLPGAGDSDANGLKASTASATLPYLAAGVFCMSLSTIATSSSGVSGLASLIGGGCFV